MQSLKLIPNDLINAIPKVVDNFNIEHKIGSGSFGTVYAASLKQNPEQRYALKHIIPTYRPDKVVNELKHLVMMKDSEHIISIETFLRYNIHVVLVMPYFEHDAFTDYFNKMTISEVQQYIKGLFTCLEVVHHYHVIHRDIKPSNFLYNYKNKTFKLIDFGLAHLQYGYNITSDSVSSEYLFAKQYTGLAKKNSHCSAVRVDGNVCSHGPLEICNACLSRPNQRSLRAGTSGFRAPEVLMQYQYQTTAVDIWSAGVIFLSLLSGKYPFFKSSNDITAMMQIVSLFGSQQCQEAANHIGKELHLPPDYHAHNLSEVCSTLKHSEIVNKACETANKCNIGDQFSTPGHVNNPGLGKKTWTTAPTAAYDLLQHCLKLNPFLRISATDVLHHSFLQIAE